MLSFIAESTAYKGFMNLDAFSTSVLSVFVAAFCIQMGYYLLLFLRLAKHRSRTVRAHNPEPVSVIICARNEAENLQKYLPLILDQDHPNFEVVVVNDHSVDETEDLLNTWKTTHDHLKFVNLTDDNTYMEGKKFAVSMGIKGATHEQLLFLDADCWPESKSWIRQMQTGFSGGAKLVLGYGAYAAFPGLLNRLIRYDTLMIAVQYLSYALAGIPYMGVGRNMGYTSDLFYKTKGFISHRHVASGDDDLMVNEVATRSNTSIVASKESRTVSIPKLTWKSWFVQKRRHLTTGGMYNLRSKVLLGMFVLSQFLFFIGLMFALVLPELRLVGVSVFMVSMVVKILCIRPVTRLLGEEDLLLHSLLLEPIMMVLNVVLPISNLISSPKKWK